MRTKGPGGEGWRDTLHHGETGWIMDQALCVFLFLLHEIMRDDHVCSACARAAAGSRVLLFFSLFSSAQS
jgi:hypothetical protein